MAEEGTIAGMAGMDANTLKRWLAGVKPVRALRSMTLLATLPFAGCMGGLGLGSGAPGLQEDGSYVLESEEQLASCDSLTKRTWGQIQLIRTLPAKATAERASPPQTASSALGRWLGGSSKGLKAIEEYDRELAHAYALQSAMRSKRCPPIDVDREIAQAAAEMKRISSE